MVQLPPLKFLVFPFLIFQGNVDVEPMLTIHTYQLPFVKKHYNHEEMH